jgi:hypothetical protein
VGDWTIRTDTPHGNVPNAQHHVHIEKRGLKGEYSWNIDGTRHDDHRFPKNEQCINAAKRHAAEALGISSNILQLVVALPGGQRVSVRGVGSSQEFRCYVRKGYVMIFMASPVGLVCIQLQEEI